MRGGLDEGELQQRGHHNKCDSALLYTFRKMPKPYVAQPMMDRFSVPSTQAWKVAQQVSLFFNM